MTTLDYIKAHYEILSKIGNLGDEPEKGFLRAAYADEESRAMRYFEAEAKKLGLNIRWDSVSNLFLETSGAQSEFVECGSHLDTVPNGGNYDGAAGIVAGFEAIRAVLQSNRTLKRGLRLRIWRGEEGATFGTPYKGSLAAFGLLDPKYLNVKSQGISLREAMVAQGADPSWIEQKRPTISQEEIDGIAVHLELHIEQGMVLESSRTQIGLVTGIRGAERYRILLEGQFNHSGTTPMGIEFRQDVNLALGYMLVRLDTFLAQQTSHGADLVQTIGVINSEQDFNSKHEEIYLNATTKVSGFGYFVLDIRGLDHVVRNKYAAEAIQLIQSTAKEFHVRATVEKLSESQGVKSLDLSTLDLAEHSANRLHLSSKRLPSGAGHDTAIVTARTKSNGSHIPGGMLFIPCREGKSHTPEELTSYEEIAAGTEVLREMFLQLAT